MAKKKSEIAGGETQTEGGESGRGDRAGWTLKRKNSSMD